MDLLSRSEVRVICAIADCGGTASAATMLHTSQPTVSRTLKAAEARLRMVLFQRGWSGAEPTTHGDTVLTHCRRIEDLLRQFDETENTPRKGRLGVVRHVRWRHLDVVAAIVRTGSATGAAAELGIRQPAISQSLSEVTAFLGQMLFDRRRNGLTARPVAQRLVILWNDIRAELAALEVALDDVGHGLVGRVAVGMLPFSEQALVMKAFGELSRQHPRVRLVAIPGSYGILAEALRQREIDIMIGVLRDPSPIKGFKETFLFEEEFALIARRRHHCHRRPVTIEMLADMNWIVAPHGTPVRTYFESLFRDFGKAPPAQTVEILSFAHAEQMIVDSTSIALLTYSKPALSRLRKDLRRVRFVLPKNKVPIGYTTLGEPKGNAAIKAFIEVLSATIQDRSRRPS